MIALLRHVGNVARHVGRVIWAVCQQHQLMMQKEAGQSERDPTMITKAVLHRSRGMHLGLQFFY